jgi:hypothetical protein
LRPWRAVPSGEKVGAEARLGGGRRCLRIAIHWMVLS